MRYKYFAPILILGLAGILFGAYGMYERLRFGLYPTNLGSYVPWGLWVAFYLFFLGLSAGAFLVNIMVYVLGMKQFQSIGPLSAFVVLVALFCEVQFIVLDLGQFHRSFYQFFLSPSFSSLLTWMFVLFNAMLLIYALKTWFLVREPLIHWIQNPDHKGPKWLYKTITGGSTVYTPGMKERDSKWIHRLAKTSVPVGLMFYGTNGAFFAILLNRPIWNSAMTPLLFIVAALVSGGALITFLTYVFRKADPLNPDGVCHEDRLCLSLGKVVLFLLVVFLLLEAMQFFVGYQGGSEAIVTSLNLIVAGPHWWVFWVFHVLIGSLIPLFLLTFKPESVKAVVWSCFLVFMTFLSVRYNFVLPDLAVYKLEGLAQTFFHARLRTDYIPNLNEWMVSTFIVSSGLVLFLLGTRFLPITQAQDQGGGAHAG